MGEETAEYENGKVVSREGSFEAGVDGAEPGVIMPADPQPGLEYRQEYLRARPRTPPRSLALALRSRSRRPLRERPADPGREPLGDPAQVENKFFAKDVGPVLTLDLTGSGREELVSYTPGG